MKITSFDIAKQNRDEQREIAKSLFKVVDVDLKKRMVDACSMIELVLLNKKWRFEGIINGFKVWYKGMDRVGVNENGKITGGIGWNKRFKPHKSVMVGKNSRRWVGLIAGKSNRI